MKKDILTALMEAILKEALNEERPLVKNAAAIISIFEKYKKPVNFNSDMLDQDVIETCIRELYKMQDGQYMLDKNNPFYDTCKSITDYLYEQQVKNIVTEALKPKEKTEEERMIENMAKIGERLNEAIENRRKNKEQNPAAFKCNNVTLEIRPVPKRKKLFGLF